MSDNPWQAERDVDAERARRLINRVAPELADAPLSLAGSGWDNTVWRVGRQWAFRFPRRQLYVDVCAAEWPVLAGLGGRLPLAVPEHRWQGSPCDEFAWPYVGVRWIEGVTADACRLDGPARSRLAAPLGAFVGALHALDPATVPTLPDDLIARADVAARDEQVRATFAKLVAAGVLADPAPWLGLLDAAPAPRPALPRADRVVCHGDLYARHIVLDPAGTTAVGVIDWGDVHLGDPAVDLQIAWAMFPPAARPAFCDAYRGAGGPPIDAATWHLARRRALFHSTMLVWAGAGNEDAALLAEGRIGLDHVLVE